MSQNQNEMNKKLIDDRNIFSKNIPLSKQNKDEEHSFKNINSNIDILLEPNIKISKTNIFLESRDNVFMDVTDNINPKKDLYNLKTRELININNTYHNNTIFNINNKNSYNFNPDIYGEVNIYELGLSGIKDDNIRDKSDKCNRIINNEDIFYLNQENSEKKIDNNNSEIILTELKSINSTFNLWGLNFDLQEFLNIKDEHFLRKLIFILKSLLIQKQNDDIINLERSRSLIALELAKKNLEIQIEKLNKNILEKEEKLKKQVQEKEKKFKEKEDEFKIEKLKLSNLLEYERNNNQKAKFKFSQVLIQIKNKEKEIEILNQKLTKILNNTNTDSNINIKIPNSNINSLFSKKEKDLDFSDFSEFFTKKHNISSMTVSKYLQQNIFSEIFKKSFCFYVNVILDTKNEMRNSLEIKKNLALNYYENFNLFNKSKNQEKINTGVDFDNSINNLDTDVNLDFNFNKYKNLLDVRSTDSEVQEINSLKIKINQDDIFLPSKVITKDQNSKLREFSSHIFDLKLEAKSEALKTIEILHDTILQINQQLFSLALNKLKQKENLKTTIFGNYGLKKSIFRNNEEEEIKKCFEKIIQDNKLYFMYNSKNAEALKIQILENLKICENLYISFENLKIFENPQNFVNKNNQNETEDFQLVFLKNEVEDYFERVLLDVKNQENKFLEKLVKEKIAGEQKDEILISISEIKHFNDIYQKLPSLKIFLNHRGKTLSNNTKITSDNYRNVSSFETKTLANKRTNNYLNVLDEMIEERKRELTSYLSNKQKSLDEPNNLFEIPEKFITDNMEIIENQIMKEEIKDDEKENNEKDSILNEFSFNQNYYGNQKNNKSLNITNIFHKEDKNFFYEENQEFPKLLIKKQPRSIYDKIYENFSLYVYLCIKSNELYINYFKMFLENEKIELTKNLDFDYNVTNKMNQENSSNVNQNKDYLYKIKENSENRENKLAFYYNFQNMLSSLIDTNSKVIKEINESFNKNYEFILDGIIEYDKNISRLQDINNNLKKSLNFLDERYESITTHSFK